MYRDEDQLFEESTLAERKPAERRRPPQSYSPRYEQRRKPALAIGNRRRLKRSLLP